MQGKKIILLLTLLITVFGLSGCGEDEPVKVEVPRLVRAIQVGGPQQLKSRNYPGRAKAVHEVNLAFDVRGTLNERPVDVGDNIIPGQLIASLDSRDFRSDVEEAKANVQHAYADFNRAKELIKKKFIAQSEYDQLRAKWRIAAAERDKATKALTDTKIKAPFAGYISELFVENFQSVQAKEKIARLVDISQIEMIIDIPESKISLVPYIKEVKVIFDAFPKQEIIATIKEVGKEASRTTRTYPVTLIMEQPKNIKILPGMSGKAQSSSIDKLASKKIQSIGIQVPISAIYSPADDKKSYAWVINEETGDVRLQVVTLGKVVSSGLVIKEGLKPGDWVATAGVHFIREGMKVRIMQDKEK